MKLLKIESSKGSFLDQNGNYTSLENITKDDVLRLSRLVISEENIDLDIFDESIVQNQAHQIIYKSISNKLLDLKNRKNEFHDEIKRTFKNIQEKYKD